MLHINRRAASRSRGMLQRAAAWARGDGAAVVRGLRSSSLGVEVRMGVLRMGVLRVLARLGIAGLFAKRRLSERARRG